MLAINPDPATLVASKNPSIVVVEDDDVFRDYLAVLLRSANCRVRPAACGRDLFAIHAAEPVDCILLDYNLVDENGLAIQERLRATMRDPPPIVMLTVERNERTIIKAFRGGIADYVLKDGMKPDELFRSLLDAMERRAQAVANDLELARLKRRSEFDDATGLYSRAAIDERLAAIARSRRSGRCAVVLIEIDDLDTVRADLGMVFADRALRAFVARLKESLGPYDLCGVYDERRFVSITDVDVRFKTITYTCRRLVQALSFDVNFDTVGLRLTASIGGAIFPLNGPSMGDVLVAAERALDNARRRGGAYAIAAEGAGEAELALAAAALDGAAAPKAPEFSPAPAPASPAVADVTETAEATASGPATGVPEVAAEARPATRIQRASDRRSAPRHRVYKRGQVVLPNLVSAIDCTIRDISATGARLRVEGHFIAPEKFELSIPSMGVRRRVCRRWQSGKELGVEFVD